MKVAYLVFGDVPVLSSGGPYGAVALILRELKKTTHNVVACLLTKEGFFEGEAAFAKIATKNFEVSKESDFLRWLYYSAIPEWLRFQVRLARNRRHVQFHWEQTVTKGFEGIVHSHLGTSTLPLYQLKNSRKHKFICTYHSKGALANDMYENFGIERKGYFYDKLLQKEEDEFHLANVVTFPSAAAFRLMKNDHSPKAFDGVDVRIIHNGIDSKQIISQIQQKEIRKRNIFTVVNVSQHVQSKRLDILLHALASLKEELQFSLLNIGDGILLEHHKYLAQQLGIAKSVEFLGRLRHEDVIFHMARADVVVMPSENVVFDLATLEAMAVGVPVIISADGGNFECIRDGVDGILTPKGDVRKVAEAIRFIKNNPGKARGYSLAARSRVQQEFSIETMMNKYLSLYSQLWAK